MSGAPPPGMPPAAAAAYVQLVEAEGSPIWTHPREDRLTPAMRAEVRAFSAAVANDPPAWQPSAEPAWLATWLAETWARVPAHAARGPLPPRLIDIPPVRRADLAADPASFVPVGVVVNELIAYTTSGTAGAPTTIPSHPVTNASYFPLIRRAARPVLDLRLRRDRLDWVTITSQDVGGFIVPSWSSITGTLTAQISLRPHGWLAIADCPRFLAEHDPACITGDPVAFEELLTLDPPIHPQLLVSTASTLPPDLRARLQQRFSAPVLDVYSLTEAGPVGGSLGESDPSGAPIHRLMQPRLFVEVLREDGSRASPGERGEIVLTGGMNRALPLIRYATGDHAVLAWASSARAPHLLDLAGRAPVVFVTAEGRRINSHSITVALRPARLPRFCVHQHADGRFRLSLDQVQAGQDATIRGLLAPILGASTPLEIGVIDDHPAQQTGLKQVPFTVAADLPGHAGSGP